MRYKIILLVLLSVSSFIQLYGQDTSTSSVETRQELDSLWTAFKQAKHDTTRIKTYLNIGDIYKDVKPDSAIFYYQKAVDLAGMTIDSTTTSAITTENSSEYKLFSLKATSLRYIGNVHEDQGSYDKAIEYYLKSLKIAEELGDKQGMAYCYYNIGVVHDDWSNYDKAMEYYLKSLSIAKELGDKEVMSACYNNLGNVHNYQDSYDKAMEYYIKSLSVAEELGDKQGMSKCYGNIGVVHDNWGNYDKAIEFHFKSLKIAEELGDKQGMSRCYGNIGNVLNDQGNYDKAIEYYLKSLKIDEEIGDKHGISINYEGIGIVHFVQGSYAKAIDYHLKSLKIYEEIGDKHGMSSSYNNIGLIYEDQGSYDKAIEYFLKSLKIGEELGDKDIMSDSYNNIGNVHFNQGSYDKAIEYLLKALKVAEELGDKKGMSETYNNIGVVHWNQGNDDKTMEYYLKSLKIAEEIGDKKGMSETYNNIGVVYWNQGNYDKALDYYLKSLKIREEIGDKNGIALSYVNIANLHITLADSAKHFGVGVSTCTAQLDTALLYANKSYKLALEIGAVPRQNSAAAYLQYAYWGYNKLDSANFFFTIQNNLNNKDILMNFSFISEKEKEKYFNTISQDYWRLNSFALEYKYFNPKIVETVYNNTIKNKGLLLKSSTAMRNAVYSSNDTLLISNYDKWILLKKQIAKKYSKGEDTKELEDRANKLEALLVKNSNEFSDFSKVQDINWKQVQKGLTDGEAAIEFLHFPIFNPDSSLNDFTNQIQYVALIVKKDSKHPEMIPLFEEKQLQKIIGTFGGNNLSYIKGIYGTNNTSKTALYNLIWKPMEQQLKGVKKVYISPSGLLYKISFSAIAKDQNIYLCDIYNINMQPSTGNIVFNKNKTLDFNNVNVSLFGGVNYNSDSTKTEIWPYLEGTKSEAENISNILKKKKVKTNYFTANNATEEEFKLIASNSNILHIATHGFFYPDPEVVEKEEAKNVETGDIVFRGGSRGFGVESFVENENPLMRSGLVLAGANDVWSKTSADTTEDGVLTAQEIAQIDMRKTDLVVMSACETGLGDIKGSEGVYGLQRSFKIAGVDKLIMSLWQVPDKETEEFMTTFYKKLLKENNIRTAFNQTQKEMRKKYDPYFWAAFVLID